MAPHGLPIHRSTGITTRRYAVVKVGEEWRIVGEERQMGHFPSRSAAALGAARLAAIAREEDCSVELLVQDSFGEMQSVGSDPAP